jgi:hypothetical protein
MAITLIAHHAAQTYDNYTQFKYVWNNELTNYGRRSAIIIVDGDAAHGKQLKADLLKKPQQ